MKYLRILKPTLSGDAYANLVTVFAVIVTVEYGTGGYDFWDLLIGIMAIVLGYSFFDQAAVNSDFWYSFLVSALVSLGVVSLLGCALELGAFLLHKTVPKGAVVEFIRFLAFMVLALLVTFKGVGFARNDV